MSHPSLSWVVWSPFPSTFFKRRTTTQATLWVPVPDHEGMWKCFPRQLQKIQSFEVLMAATPTDLLLGGFWTKSVTAIGMMDWHTARFQASASSTEVVPAELRRSSTMSSVEANNSPPSHERVLEESCFPLQRHQMASPWPHQTHQTHFLTLKLLMHQAAWTANNQRETEALWPQLWALATTMNVERMSSTYPLPR